MIEVLINHILSFIDDFVCWHTVKHYEEAIVLQFGKYKRTVKPGIHWKFPFIEKPIVENIVYTTLSIPVQSLVTRDKQAIVVKGVVKYKISDIKLFLLEVNDAKDAISDTTQSVIALECSRRDWSQIIGEELDNEISKKLRTMLKKWGIYVDTVTLSDKTLSKSFRLFNENIINT